MPVGRTGAHAGATPSIGSAAVVLAAGARRFTPSGLFLPTPDRAMAIRDDFSSLHLNCGIVGALMRGGGGAATLAALPTPLGSLLLNALLSVHRRLLGPLLDFPLRPSLRLARHHLRVAPKSTPLNSV
jgi:hypothetical protein